MAAVIPGLAEIAPDAVNVAIHKNPQWPDTTKLTLEGMAIAANKSPTAAVTGFFGGQQNNADTLWLIPMYWIEKFAPREKQVELLSNEIARRVNKTPDERGASN